MWNRRAKTSSTFIIAGVLLIYWIYGVQRRTGTFPSDANTRDPDRSGIFLDTCILKELDPWDAEINALLDTSYDPIKNCVPTFEMATKLENGKLYLLDQRDSIQCWWQCLFPKNDSMLTQGGWNKLTNGSVPECDIVETACFNSSVELTPDEAKSQNKTYYEYLHAQIYRKDKPEKLAKTPPLDRPDVHIIVVDSVSYSQSVRALPKTRHFLHEHFGATSFPYLNKVGLNSRPNAYAFLMGKNIVDIKKSPLSVGYPHDCGDDQTCCKLLEKDYFISKKYKEASYTTMMSEDSKATMFASEYCDGFNYTPVDHFMRPYQLRVETQDYKTALLKNSVYKGSCRESFMPQMDYLQDFIEKYSDKPKFTITWMAHLAHDDNKYLFHSDDYYYNFFRNNSDKLDNSYVIFMADHGIRYGKTRLTAAGEGEDNNPFLLMALPASLRDNDTLTATIRHNARQLVSQYDMYATLVDIVAPFQPKTSSELPLYGTSVLKPLPQPRSCDRLRIPFEYCICDYPRSKLPDDAAPGREAATLLVESMNNVLNTVDVLQGICEPLTLINTPVAVESITAEGSLSIFKVTFKVEPGEGHFYGYVSQNQTTAELSVLSHRMPRLDSYAVTAYCAKASEYAAYCYCSELKTTTTTAPMTTTTTPTVTSTSENGAKGIMNKLFGFK